jgi:hypothetical protein
MNQHCHLTKGFSTSGDAHVALTQSLEAIGQATPDRLDVMANETEWASWARFEQMRRKSIDLSSLTDVELEALCNEDISGYRIAQEVQERLSNAADKVRRAAK